MDLNNYLNNQKEWSLATFGPGKRTLGVTKHIESEIAEIRADPADSKEWIDIVILALDGYWRSGGENVEAALVAKQEKNFNRMWPRSISEDEPVMHTRGIED